MEFSKLIVLLCAYVAINNFFQNIVHGRVIMRQLHDKILLINAIQ